MRQTIHDYIQMQETLGRSVSTIYHYRRRLITLQCWLMDLGLRDIREVQPKHLQDWHDHLIAQSISVNSRYAYMTTIRDFFQWAYSSRRTLSGLSACIELPRLEKTLPPKPLTFEQVQGLFKLLPPTSPGRIRNLAMLMVMYGGLLRKSELLSLNIGSLDWENQTLHVKGKGSKDRIIPLPSVCFDSIRNWLVARGGKPKRTSPLWVTLNMDGKGSKRVGSSEVNQLFRYLNEHCPVHVHPHLLRHSAAVHMLMNGASIRHVQQVLGHDRLDTTARYLHIVKTDLKQAYDQAVGSMLQDAS